MIVLVMFCFVLVAYFLASFRLTPAYHFRVVFFFETPVMILTDGLSFTPAVIFPVSNAIPLSPRPTTSAEKEGAGGQILTLDGSVIMEWTFRWRPDPTVLDRDGRPCMFASQSLDNIHNGLREAISSRIGEVAGMRMTEDFVNMKAAVDLYINSVLMLKHPAHILHDERGCNGWYSKCKFKKAVKPEKVLDFYKDHEAWVRWLLEDEKKHPYSNQSQIELQFGIDGIEFNSDIRQPEELEEVRRQELEAKSLRKVNDDIEEHVRMFKHAPPELYRSAVRIFLGKRIPNWQSFSIDGLGGSGGRHRGGHGLAKDVAAAAVVAQQVSRATERPKSEDKSETKNKKDEKK